MPGIAMLALLLLPAHASQTESEVVRVVRHWVDAARVHQPGIIDRPLLDMSLESPEHIDIVRHHLRTVIKVDLPSLDAQTELLRRGALMHTDIAVLLPQQAAQFTTRDLPTALDPYSDRPPIRNQTNALVFSVDGQYMAGSEESAHWWMARLLLSWIRPHPSADPFVALWYRAIAARFEGARLFGNAKFHLERALEVLPRDAVLLFYAGAMHEAHASPAVQSIPLPGAGPGQSTRMPSRDDEWKAAERMFRDSAEAGGPPEARVRLGRVLGRLGRHADAVSALESVAGQLQDRRLQYLAALFLGSEEGALHHVDRARASLERAAALYPTAQSPLLALSALFDRAGNRSAALDALRRLSALSADPEARID